MFLKQKSRKQKLKGNNLTSPVCTVVLFPYIKRSWLKLPSSTEQFHIRLSCPRRLVCIFCLSLLWSHLFYSNLCHLARASHIHRCWLLLSLTRKFTNWCSHPLRRLGLMLFSPNLWGRRELIRKTELVVVHEAARASENCDLVNYSAHKYNNYHLAVSLSAISSSPVQRVGLYNGLTKNSHYNHVLFEKPYKAIVV